MFLTKRSAHLNPIKTTDPFSLIINDFNTMIDRWFNNISPLDYLEPLGRRLSADVVDNDDHYLVKVEMPGAEESDIDITYDSDTLNISCNYQSDTEEKNKNSIYRECMRGTYRRSIYLPNIKEDEIKAVLQKGILSITCPKSNESTTRKVIPIEVKD